jgi:hypothetical protein
MYIGERADAVVPALLRENVAWAPWRWAIEKAWSWHFRGQFMDKLARVIETELLARKQLQPG